MHLLFATQRGSKCSFNFQNSIQNLQSSVKNITLWLNVSQTLIWLWARDNFRCHECSEVEIQKCFFHTTVVRPRSPGNPRQHIAFLRKRQNPRRRSGIRPGTHHPTNTQNMFEGHVIQPITSLSHTEADILLQIHFSSIVTALPLQFWLRVILTTHTHVVVNLLTPLQTFVVLFHSLKDYSIMLQNVLYSL